MEGARVSLTTLKRHFRRIEETRNMYSYPFPEETVVRKIWEKSPAHVGTFRGAVDFIVDLGTPVLCPLEGKVVKVVDTNDKFGPTEDFADYLNYIIIRHANGEFSQPAHLAKGSALVKEGDRVLAGQQLAVTGNSGWMTEPHLHFFVFKGTNNDSGFIGLKIKFKK